MRSEDLDKRLDEALADYAKPEIPLGLEQRVLNRIQAEGPVRRFISMRWALAAAAVACLVILTVVFWTRRPLAPEPTRR